MSLHTLTRQHIETATHQLTDQELANFPETTTRVLLLVLPYLFALISSIVLSKRLHRVRHNYFTYPALPDDIFSLLHVVGLLALGVAGVEAAIDNAWHLKSWILFAVVNVLIGVSVLVYSLDNLPALTITWVLLVLAAFSNQWLFIDLKSMWTDTTNHKQWRQVDRNLISFVQGVLVLLASETIGQFLVYVLGVGRKCQTIFYWITTPLVLIGLIIWNAVNEGGIVETIGLIVASVIGLAAAAYSTKFNYHKHEDGLVVKN